MCHLEVLRGVCDEAEERVNYLFEIENLLFFEEKS